MVRFRVIPVITRARSSPPTIPYVSVSWQETFAAVPVTLRAQEMHYCTFETVRDTRVSIIVTDSPDGAIAVLNQIRGAIYCGTFRLL